MKSIRVELYLGTDRALLQSRALAGREPSLPTKPYVVEVRALDEANKVMGGIQHFEAATPIQLLEVLSTRYGTLFQQWKIVVAQNKSLRARLSNLNTDSRSHASMRNMFSPASSRQCQ
jgi:hypothetical protein